MLREEQIPKLIADFKRVDLMDIKWKGRGMMCRQPVCHKSPYPRRGREIREASVGDQPRQEALSQGDEHRALAELATITPGATSLSRPMPGNPRRQITDQADTRFPLRITIRTPPGGFGTRYTTMMDWLDEHCGIDGWAIGPAGTRGIRNDAIAVYVGNPTCALAFIARWCLPGDPPGMYEFRKADPPGRVPAPHHKTP